MSPPPQDALQFTWPFKTVYHLGRPLHPKADHSEDTDILRSNAAPSAKGNYWREPTAATWLGTETTDLRRESGWHTTASTTQKVLNQPHSMQAALHKCWGSVLLNEITGGLDNKEK
jgi:hypothetical protein